MHKKVYLVERLVDFGYEVVALTSTKEKGEEAARYHFTKLHKKIIKDSKEIDSIRETVTNNEVPIWKFSFSDGLLAEDDYLIVPCTIDNPYWFGKDEK